MSSDIDNRSKPKDFWDKLNVIGSPLIALVGLLFTFTYSMQQESQKALLAQQQRDQQKQESLRQKEVEAQHAAIESNQLKLQRLETIQRFYQELLNPDTKRRSIALRVIKNSDDEQLATRLAVIFDDHSLDDIFARPATAPTTAAIPTSSVSSPETPSIRQGWAYLGDYKPDLQAWKTQYFDFPASSVPESIQSTSQRVSRRTGQLNVRSGMPTLVGEFPEVIDVLPTGTVVKILSVRPWLDSSYQWAKVEYAAIRKR